MLILFDIDGTLLRSEHAGASAMREVASDLFGCDCSMDGVEIAGRLDPLIWQDLAAKYGLADPMAHHDRFRSMYTARLESRLRENPTVSALPGVMELVDRLGDVDGLTLGLLTGNYPETGRLKVRSAGLDPERFTANAFGSDGPLRRDLPPVAMAQYARLRGAAIEPERVVVIGDTPHDVDCARHHGCRSVAVATGGFSRDDLRACGPDLLLDDLSETASVVAWILGSS